MALRLVAAVLGIVGLYLNTWHNNVPFSHFEVFGREFGSNHVMHSIVGLILLAAAAWLWMRSTRAMTTRV